MSFQICDYNKCSGCGACVLTCPQKCIDLQYDTEGFLRPTIKDDCTGCNICKKTCPVNNINAKNSHYKSKSFAAINTNDAVRLTSSSGGVFSVLAEEVIDNGGVIFGAKFNDDFSVEHTFIENKNDLCIIRGSKYVQSILADSYKQVKKFLENDRFVLFSGTPCQVEGLYAFLKKDYSNLITIDFVCHGVPSPMIWKKYCDFRAKKAKSDISYISFRNKNESWKEYSVLYSFCNNSEYRIHHDDDPYMQLFINNFSLRPSCYNCQFKKTPSVSDLTIADFWGVEYYLDDFDDDKGTSAVIINSEKGDKCFSSIRDNILTKETDVSVIIETNYCYIHSVNIPRSRKYLFKQMRKKDFNVAYKKFKRLRKLIDIYTKIRYFR